MKPVVILIFSLCLLSTIWADETVVLSPEEKLWIEEHPVIRMAPDPFFAPLEFFEDGEYKGISADYLALITERIGLNVEIIKTDNWDQALGMLKTREADFNAAMMPTVERKEYLLFTEHIFDSDILIFSTLDNQEKIKRKDLIDRKVGIISGYAEDEFLSLVLPELELTRYISFDEALTDLSLGRLEYFIGDLAFIGYQKKNMGLTNIVIVGEIDFRHKLGFAVRSDWPELRSILQKGLDTISDEEKNKIHEKWIGLMMINNYISKSVLPYVFSAIGLIIFTLILIIVWNRSLSHRVDRKTAELNSELEAKKIQTARLEYSNEEKERLLYEVHHRVNNNMQMVLGLLQCGFEENSISRIRIVALVQSMGHSDINVNMVDVPELAVGIIEGLQDDYDSNFADSVQISSDGFVCGIKESVGIGLILNEVLINLFDAGIIPDSDCMLSFINDISGEKRMRLSISSRLLDDESFEGPADGPSVKLIRIMIKDLQAEISYSKEGDDHSRCDWELVLPKTRVSG